MLGTIPRQHAETWAALEYSGSGGILFKREMWEGSEGKPDKVREIKHNVEGRTAVKSADMMRVLQESLRRNQAKPLSPWGVAKVLPKTRMENLVPSAANA
jgi:hypothetical protein